MRYRDADRLTLTYEFPMQIQTTVMPDRTDPSIGTILPNYLDSLP